MPHYLLTIQGHPTIFDAVAFHGVLFDAQTWKPLLDVSRLSPEQAEEAQQLVDEYKAPSIRDMQIAARNAVEGLPRDGKKLAFKAARAESKKDFFEVNRLLKEPALQEALLCAPEPGLLAGKLAIGDHRFTPQELQRLKTPVLIRYLMREGHDLFPVVMGNMSSQEMQRVWNGRIELIRDLLRFDCEGLALDQFEQLSEKAQQDQAIYPVTLLKHALQHQQFAMAEKLIAIAGQVYRTNLPSPRDSRQLIQLINRYQQVLREHEQEAAENDFSDPLPRTLKGKPLLDVIRQTEAWFLMPHHHEIFDKLFPGEDHPGLAEFLHRRITWKGLDYSSTPVKDAIEQIRVPQSDHWHPKQWREQATAQMAQPLSESNPDLLMSLHKAARYETLAREAKLNFSRLTPERIRRLEKDVRYTDGDEDPELEAICLRHAISQKTFTEALNRRKRIGADLIPDIGYIDGEELGFPGYYMVKLNKRDPRILFTGFYTGCCDQLNDAGEAMALAHVSSPYSGCYALFKKEAGRDDIMVGKVAVWLSKPKDRMNRRDLCFNSWECVNTLPLKEVGQAFLEEASRRALRADSLIDRVLIGKNKDGFPVTLVTDMVRPQQKDCATADSRNQHLLMSRRLMAARPEVPRMQARA